MERVIGHVYAFYLRFLPPFFSFLTLSLSPLFPLATLGLQDEFLFHKEQTYTHISETF